MNNKIFRIILMFLAVCISSISTLFAVSFGLSNLSLGNENQDLTQENEDLNEEVEDLNQIVSDFENMVNNLDEHAAIVTYELDGLIWRIQIVQKNKEFNLPEIAETDEQLFSGWKLNGEGEVLTTALVEADTKFTAEMIDKDWVPMSWNGISPSSSYIWTDGKNIYHSNGKNHHMLINNNTWETITWTGLTNFYGSEVWRDETNTYYSKGNTHYILKDNNMWEKITWTGLTDFYASEVWTDGTNTYYSNGSNQYMLKTNNSWEPVTWIGLTDFDGGSVWTDGSNYYYSREEKQFILRENYTWEKINWNIDVVGSSVWTDGKNIYHSYYKEDQSVLDKETNTWIKKEWLGVQSILGSFSGWYIWTDGTNIYCSSGSDHYIFNRSKNA